MQGLRSCARENNNCHPTCKRRCDRALPAHKIREASRESQSTPTKNHAANPIERRITTPKRAKSHLLFHDPRAI
jgi:hypothetical protein